MNGSFDSRFPQLRELRLVYSRLSTVGPSVQLARPLDAVFLIQAGLAAEAVEVCVVMLLSTKGHVIAVHEIGRGTLDTCAVHPRDVFKAALLANAASVIVCHNHPSGDPSPSPDDVAVCARLRQSADVLGIDLLDFLIVGDGGRYYSFKEAGR